MYLTRNFTDWSSRIMDKIKMDLDDLHVQSFETTSEPKHESGTVHGQQPQNNINDCCGTITEGQDGCNYFCVSMPTRTNEETYHPCADVP